MKLNHWFYRRFIGTRRDLGAATGKQKILDVPRAKWKSYDAMRPYFVTYVSTLVENGIAIYNSEYAATSITLTLTVPTVATSLHRDPCISPHDPCQVR
jgi:hypothetical protein